MTNHPIKAKVAQSTYKIQWQLGPVISDGDECFGDCDSAAQLIRMDSTCTSDQKKSKLMHELVHGYAYELGYAWTKAQVRQVERVLFMLLRENKGIVKWAMQSNKEQHDASTDEAGAQESNG